MTTIYPSGLAARRLHTTSVYTWSSPAPYNISSHLVPVPVAAARPRPERSVFITTTVCLYLSRYLVLPIVELSPVFISYAICAVLTSFRWLLFCSGCVVWSYSVAFMAYVGLFHFEIVDDVFRMFVLFFCLNRSLFKICSSPFKIMYTFIVGL